MVICPHLGCNMGMSAAFANDEVRASCAGLASDHMPTKKQNLSHIQTSWYPNVKSLPVHTQLSLKETRYACLSQPPLAV